MVNFLGRDLEPGMARCKISASELLHNTSQTIGHCASLRLSIICLDFRVLKNVGSPNMKLFTGKAAFEALGEKMDINGISDCPVASSININLVKS